MRSMLKWKLNAFLLSVTVIFTMGMGINVDDSNNHPSYIFSHQSPTLTPSTLTIATESSIPATQLTPSVPPTSNTVPSEPIIVNGLPSLVQAPTADLNRAFEVNRQPELNMAEINVMQQNGKPLAPAVAQYEVTAYLLNVRAYADAATEIIEVVQRGSVLEVVEVSDNGWLKLKLAGYVSAKYAKLLSGPSGAREAGELVEPSTTEDSMKESARVKVLSVQHPAEEITATKAWEIAVNGTGEMSAEPEEDGSGDSAKAPIKPTSMVNSTSSLTEEHIAQIFEGTALSGYELEKAILEVEQEYGINAYFTIAVMKLESGHGKSLIARNKNNMFGLNAIDNDAYNKAFSFETKGDSVQKFGQLISEHYVDKGYTSIEKVARKYCQANPQWPILVKQIMESDYKKLL
ncbi:glucosaminidase domain-containing protein [Paenibacillus agricola]|uniref:Mannosyl-glycoprotein endo-beta-N-acetylglucosamidase-like domain-containing protein n=1 Tax=Paenibacillus agricola TaxID=2716264 RepID=A0ABX0JA17_9BACL|nr:glucosaminidase domain-containing protein [Paenibacillus agricola]NHN30821.1 hypothetical protein [Paenibacillus agricola]